MEVISFSSSHQCFFFNSTHFAQLFDTILERLKLNARQYGNPYHCITAFKGIVKQSFDGWRFTFIGGLIGAGVLQHAIEIMPMPTLAMVSPLRAAIAGALVGVGTASGNGCTSGHGICGNSRFSIRSMLYTGVFMIAGAMSACLGDTNGALGVNSESSTLSLGVLSPTSEMIGKWVALACVGITMFVGLGFAARDLACCKPQESENHKKAVDIGSDLVAGLVFGVGLVISGMMDPAKVSGFLTVIKPSFDPTLILVMGGAMCWSIPGFFLITKKSNPACSWKKFDIPTNKNIDMKLIGGGVLFGAGWGLAGICPGPAVVAAVTNPGIELMVWLLSFVAGIAVHEYVPNLLGNKPAETASYRTAPEQSGVN